MAQDPMTNQDVETAFNQFRRRQHLLRTIFFLLLVTAAVITLAILAYSSHRRRLAEAARDKTSKEAQATTNVTFANTASQLVTLDDAIRANDRIKELAQQISTTGNAAQQRAAKEIRDNADLVASQLKASIDSSRILQDQVIQNSPWQLTSAGKYGIVVSANKRNDLAEYEVKKLKELHMNVAVYDRQGFLRTVALMDNPDDASKELPAIQKYRWPTAYIVNMDRFCSNEQETNRQIGGATVFTCK